MADQSEIQELQLNQLESEICGLTMEELIKVAEHVKVTTEELSKFQLSKRIRKKIEEDVEAAEEKKTLLEEISEVVGVEPPPLETDAVNDSKVQADEQQDDQAMQNPTKVKKTATTVAVEIFLLLSAIFKSME